VSFCWAEVARAKLIADPARAATKFIFIVSSRMLRIVFSPDQDATDSSAWSSGTPAIPAFPPKVVRPKGNPDWPHTEGGPEQITVAVGLWILICATGC
jgi:hypothetical protein